MRRFRDLLIFALCILFALTPMVSANSGPTSWRGTTVAGLTVTGEDCPIVVDHEKLTFDLLHVPQEYYAEEKDFEEYDGSVTAEYTFRNPTDTDVTVKLLFPFGIRPDYAPAGWSMPRKSAVTADGEPVETVLRHSLSRGSDFVMVEDSALLLDDFMEHPFYSPDMTVTKYLYRPEGVDWEEYASVRAMLRLESDPAKTKYILDPANSFSVKDDHAVAGSSLRDGDVAELYIIGAVPDSLPVWSVTKAGEPIEGTMELVSSETMSLEAYIRTTCTEHYDVSQIDVYNAFVHLMDQVEAAHGYLSVGFRMELMQWYEYELTIPAGETLVNTVTAPMYPDINSAWNPSIYTYKYLLSPAKGWADFGSLDIFIRSRYILRECNLGGFEDTGYGYELHLDSLPQTELEFVLCSSAHPERPGTHGMKTLLFYGIAAAVLIGGLMRLKRKR